MCMYVYHMYAQCPQRSEECVRSLGTGGTDGCESSFGCWELSLGLLEEQPMTLTTEPSSQKQGLYVFA